MIQARPKKTRATHDHQHACPFILHAFHRALTFRTARRLSPPHALRCPAIRLFADLSSDRTITNPPSWPRAVGGLSGLPTAAQTRLRQAVEAKVLSAFDLDLRALKELAAFPEQAQLSLLDRFLGSLGKTSVRNKSAFLIGALSGVRRRSSRGKKQEERNERTNQVQGRGKPNLAPPPLPSSPPAAPG